MSRYVRLLFAILAVHALIFSSTAAARTDVIVDAQGDVAVSDPAYVDIVQARVTEQVGRDTLVFQIELAGAVPDSPSGFVAFNPVIDTPGGPTGDFGLVVRWCSQATQPASPRLPPPRVKALRTSATARLRLSVRTSTRIAAPPGP